MAEWRRSSSEVRSCHIIIIDQMKWREREKKRWKKTKKKKKENENFFPLHQWMCRKDWADRPIGVKLKKIIRSREKEQWFAWMNNYVSWQDLSDRCCCCRSILVDICWADLTGVTFDYRSIMGGEFYLSLCIFPSIDGRTRSDNEQTPPQFQFPYSIREKGAWSRMDVSFRF